MKETHTQLDIEIKPVKIEFEDLKYELIQLDEELKQYEVVEDKQLHDKYMWLKKKVDKETSLINFVDAYNAMGIQDSNPTDRFINKEHQFYKEYN